MVCLPDKMFNHIWGLTTESSSHSPLNTETMHVKPVVFCYRYILLLFASLGFAQGLVWNTWGPIAASSEFAFGWTDGTIALMSNWGPISYIIITLLFAWLMDVKGIQE